MSASVLAVSNFRNSSMAYLGALAGYGFRVEDTRTFEAARVLLRTGSNPDVILIDVKFQTEEIAEFIHFLRHEMGNREVGIVVMGYENDTLLAYGANACLERPVQLQELFAILEPVR
jgi:DNA-binding response OmpR family regulator